MTITPRSNFHWGPEKKHEDILEDRKKSKKKAKKGKVDDKEEKLIRDNSAKDIEKMDEDLPGYAWDLLPYKNKPLDLYRSPLWHAEYKNDFKQQYFKLKLS